MSASQKTAPPITCTTKLYAIGSSIIARLPHDASAQLPSRSQLVVEGTLSGVHFKEPLEPDGTFSHWFSPSAALLKAAGAAVGDTVKLTIAYTKDWPEPQVPADLHKALAAHPKAHDLWQQVTPMARWEWIRWIRSTNRDETRQRRIEVGCSKLTAGKRRPCCWNRNLCTDPAVSKNGILLDPS